MTIEQYSNQICSEFILQNMPLDGVALHSYIGDGLYKYITFSFEHKKYFGKVFTARFDWFQAEITHYQSIKPILKEKCSNLVLHKFFEEYTLGILVYEYINAPLLSEIIKPGISIDTINNIYCLIAKDVGYISKTANRPHSVLYDWFEVNPFIQKHLVPLNNEYYKSFLAVYESITSYMKNEINTRYAGVFTDRTPRNIFIHDRTYTHIDFEHFDKASPLFDLAKLVTNCYYRDNEKFHTVDLSIDRFLGAFAEEYFQKNTIPDNFQFSYYMALFNTRVFYIALYLYRIKTQASGFKNLDDLAEYHLNELSILASLVVSKYEKYVAEDLKITTQQFLDIPKLIRFSFNI